MSKKKKTIDAPAPETVSETQPTNPANDIDNILAGYKQPASVIEQEQDFSTAPETPGDLSDPTKYYQTGLKKGQPRPGGGRKSKQEESNTITSELISGALFITLIDLLFPMLISAINNKFSKTKIEAADLQLTPKQKAEIEPLSNEVVKYININGHPIALFCIAMGGIYGLNFMSLKMAKQ